MYDVHLGVVDQSVDLARSTLGCFTSVVATYADGDGWNCWGEQPGTDVNDADTRHVIARVRTVGQAIDLALDLAGEPWRDLLTASTSHEHGGNEDPKQNGVLVVVSQTEDWAEQFLLVTVHGTETLANVHLLDGQVR